MKLTLFSISFSVTLEVTKLNFAGFAFFETTCNKELLQELERQDLIQVNNDCYIIRRGVEFEIN
jgi:hypothetical protein